MNYFKQITWAAATLGIMSLAAPSVWAQSGGHTQGSAHTMLTPGDLKVG